MRDDENIEAACRDSLETAELLFDKSKYDSADVQLSEDTPQIVTSGHPPYRVIDVNEQWLKYCGYRKEEVLGQTLSLL